MAEIMANLDDINAHLPSEDNVIKADETNTVNAQVSAARLIRGYLSRVISSTTLNAWSEPAATPDIIREVAGMLIASQVFFNQTSQSSLTIEERHFAQILYDRAIAILSQIVQGTIALPDVVAVDPERMTELDFFPRDDTDRAFTLGMIL